MSIYTLLLLLFSYIIGAIPTGYWFAKLFYNLDITAGGSGNIGATNVARLTKHKWHFFLILALDAGKAALALFVIKKILIYFTCHSGFLSCNFGPLSCNFGPLSCHPGITSCHPELDPGSLPLFLIISAAFLLIGNGFSPFLRFGGGKGVSTFLGILLILFSWHVATFFIISMMFFTALFRRVDVASVSSVAILPIFYSFVASFSWSSFGLLVFSAIWIMLRHRRNFKKA